MSRTKSGTFPPFVKLLTLLQEGTVVTKDERSEEHSSELSHTDISRMPSSA